MGGGKTDTGRCKEWWILWRLNLTSKPYESSHPLIEILFHPCGWVTSASVKLQIDSLGWFEAFALLRDRHHSQCRKKRKGQNPHEPTPWADWRQEATTKRRDLGKTWLEQAWCKHGLFSLQSLSVASVKGGRTPCTGWAFFVWLFLETFTLCASVSLPINGSEWVPAMFCVRGGETGNIYMLWLLGAGGNSLRQLSFRGENRRLELLDINVKGKRPC